MNCMSKKEEGRRFIHFIFRISIYRQNTKDVEIVIVVVIKNLAKLQKLNV